ncbi:hypothetical protein ACFYU8_23720 [Brevibacillus sp. NPDC003359]
MLRAVGRCLHLCPLFWRMEELEKIKFAYARKITSMDIERIKQMEAIK